jgi:predicted glycogen debranching enzyme
MDAKVGDHAFTPRVGKPVEVQALWYNALCVMRDLAHGRGDRRDASKYSQMASRAKRSFNARFWNHGEGCLYDVIDARESDASVRPNQIFAVSLTHTMLSRQKARKVVEKVESELLTPVGLRSLSPRDAQYIGTYIGSPYERDSAYHQGTVWAWLTGHFVDAYRKVHSLDAKAAARIGEIVAGLEMTLSQTMLGQVGEIFDGDAPHAPRGAAAQAWSVAELLRAKKQVG